jgi:hypothetical protein
MAGARHRPLMSSERVRLQKKSMCAEEARQALYLKQL